MNTFEDISQEELTVFLQEADEQLQLLDEDLIRLEKEGADQELLQEIFRAAHTLKGSSAMVGLEDMSKVAHSAETVLDKLRNGLLDIDTDVIDALLHSLDVLKILRENMLGNGEPPEIGPVRAELERIATGDNRVNKTSENKQADINDELLAEARGSMQEDDVLLVIQADISPESPFPAVRMFQVLDELSRHGTVVNSLPARETIEAGCDDKAIQVCLSSHEPEDEIRASLTEIPEVIRIEVKTDDGNSRESLSRGTTEERTTVPAENERARKSGPVATQTSQTVRVDVKLLDDLMNNVGEMVIERNKIRQSIRLLEAQYEGNETITALRDTSARIIKLVSELQENVLQARMLPIGTVFNGFPRLIRDISQKMGKKVELMTDGQETELDRTILEQIRDPLVHLLRNAVDHGIEKPEDRLAAGKQEKGVILLSAYQEQNYIIIVVEDDGHGIDIDKVKQKSVEQGQISSEEAERMSDEDAMRLIFRSGLSTAQQVTEVSGRGVGMDVVHTNIESVGGAVSIESKLGEGTRFTIRLPLTLATINGLLVACGGTTYVIPMASLVEVLKLKKEDIESISGKKIIRVREQLLPLHGLDSTLEQCSHQNNGEESILVVIIRSGARAAGIIVDSVMETQETVVKSLGKYVGTIKGIAGATILGDGRVALILDTATLISGITTN